MLQFRMDSIEKILKSIIEQLTVSFRIDFLQLHNLSRLGSCLER